MQNGAICLQYTKKELDTSRDTFIPPNSTPSSHKGSASTITSEHQATIHWQISSDQGFKIKQLEDSFRDSTHHHWCLLPHDAAGNGAMLALSNKHRARLQLEGTTIILLQSKELLGFIHREFSPNSTIRKPGGT